METVSGGYGILLAAFLYNGAVEAEQKSEPVYFQSAYTGITLPSMFLHASSAEACVDQRAGHAVWTVS